jgi:hypothetical protein
MKYEECSARYAATRRRSDGPAGQPTPIFTIMSATVFDNSEGAGDAPYLQWLHDHAAGWVVNSRRRRDPSYMVLHKATCHSINRTARQADDNPFTSRGYIKVCSEEPDPLLVWIRQNGGAGFGNRCSLCEA